MEATNINLNVVSQNRKPISILGGNLGTQYFLAEARASWPEFAKAKMEIESNNNVDFILNRNPRRFRLTGHDILAVSLGTDAVGATKVFLNPGQEDEVCVPISSGMEQTGNLTEDKITRALRGEKGVIFSDPAKLATHLNQLNIDEKNRLIGIRDMLNKFISQIDSAIAENNKKADAYNRELVDSTPDNLPGTQNGATVVVVED